MNAALPFSYRERFMARSRFNSGCYLIILPTIALLLSFDYLPVVWAFFKSFYKFEVGTKPKYVGLANYVERSPTWFNVALV